jgi:hypothetical protein
VRPLRRSRRRCRLDVLTAELEQIHLQRRGGPSFLGEQIGLVIEREDLQRPTATCSIETTRRIRFSISTRLTYGMKVYRYNFEEADFEALAAVKGKFLMSLI